MGIMHDAFYGAWESPFTTGLFIGAAGKAGKLSVDGGIRFLPTMAEFARHFRSVGQATYKPPHSFLAAGDPIAPA
jgi:hypothetical protein